MDKRITTLVMPVYDMYAQAVARQRDGLTCLVRGWREPDAVRMVTARAIVDAEGLMPVLFRPLERAQDDHTVTHVAMCGFLAFRDEVAADPVLRDELHRLRVEHASLAPGHDWFSLGPDTETVNFYVVTAGVALPKALPLQSLHMANEDRMLSPNLQQAFALVDLPESLLEWYLRECGKGETLTDRFGLLRSRTVGAGGSERPKSGRTKATKASHKRAFTYTDSRGYRKIAWLPG